MPWIDEGRLQRLEADVSRILRVQQAVLRSVWRTEIDIDKEEQKMSEISDAVAKISAAVAAESSVVDSVEVLTNSLSQQIKDLAAQLAGTADVGAAVAALNELSGAVDAKAAELSANVLANTPAAPTP